MRRMTIDEFLWALMEVRDNGIYAKRLKELEAAQAALTKKLGVVDTVEKAEAFMAKVKEQMAAVEKQAEADKLERQNNEAKYAARKMQLEKELEEKLADARRLSNEARMQKLEAEKLLKTAQEAQAQAIKDIQRAAATGDELRVWETSLKEKAAKLKDIVNG